jgi:hypothetical protein
MSRPHPNRVGTKVGTFSWWCYLSLQIPQIQNIAKSKGGFMKKLNVQTMNWAGSVWGELSTRARSKIIFSKHDQKVAQTNWKKLSMGVQRSIAVTLTRTDLFNL